MDEVYLDDFLKNPSKYDKFSIDSDYDHKNGIIYLRKNRYPLAVVMRRNKENILLLNADEGENYGLVSECSDYEFPIWSFACLSRFYNKTQHDSRVNITGIAKKLAAGKFKLVDSTEEVWKDISSDQIDKLNDWREEKKGVCPVKPPAGFAIVGDRFHKAGGALLREVKGNSMLFGVDDSQYFGCKLETHPKNIKEAFLHLMPEEIRTKKGVKRQGEWFFVPVAQKDFPEYGEFDFWTEEKSFILPIDDPESNAHIVYCSIGGIKNGAIYVENPRVEHEQHRTLVLDGFYRVYKNVALESVSQEGVD